MSDVMEKQILNKLGTMNEDISSLKKGMNRLLQYLEDARLTDDEKKLLDESLKEHKEGKLHSKEEVFG